MRYRTVFDKTQHGQAMYESILLTIALVAGMWGWRWMAGGNGMVAVLLEAMRDWHGRFAALLALPV